MPSFFHNILSDLDDLQIGIFLDVNPDGSVVEKLPCREFTRTFPHIRASNASYLNDGWISFYDYGNNKHGALSLLDGSIWTHAGQPKYIGPDSRSDCVAVQFQSQIQHHSLATGEIVETEEVSGDVLALNARWAVTKADGIVSLSLGGASILEFEPRGQIYEIFESEGHLILIERQGRIQIVDLKSGILTFERQAPEGSEYRKAAISQLGLLTYTQHYFGRTGTIVHQHHLETKADLNTREIDLGGSYHLRKRGSEIYFGTCQIYCSTTAELLLDNRT